MTQLLEKAIAATTKLPDSQQDTIAQLILEEIASESKWDNSFARSQDLLARMAAAAAAEDEAGLTEELDPSKL